MTARTIVPKAASGAIMARERVFPPGAAMSETSENKDVTTNEPGSTKTLGSAFWRFQRGMFPWAYGALVLIFLGSLLVRMFPVEGAVAGIAAIPVLVAQSSAAALVIMTVVWFAAFSSCSSRARTAIVAAILLPVIALAASVRDIDFTADMVAVPVFRWQKTQTEVVDEYRKKEAAAPLASQARQVPAITPEDMPGYRGTARDGIDTGPRLREDWNTNPPKELWKRPVGEGYSQFVVSL